MKKKSKKVESKTLTMKTDSIGASLSRILVRPVISEKAAMQSNNSVYQFVVTPTATKTEIKKAIKALYGVDAEKVTITVSKPVTRVIRGRRGTVKAEKRARVFLPAGSVIELI
jgi:large subunit ribosomal protein L23